MSPIESAFVNMACQEIARELRAGASAKASTSGGGVASSNPPGGNAR